MRAEQQLLLLRAFFSMRSTSSDSRSSTCRPLLRSSLRFRVRIALIRASSNTPSFHPRHLSQLHRSVHGGSERSEGLPRLIVPVWPVKARPAKRVVVMRHRSPVGTFGSSDGRMGPAFLPVAVQKSLAARWRSQMDMRAAAVEAAALTHDTNVKPQLRPEGKRANGRRGTCAEHHQWQSKWDR